MNKCLSIPLQANTFATLHLYDWIVIVGFLLLIIVVGLSLTKQASKNLSSFFLGGRNLPWYIAGISMVATTFAADTPLAVTELIGTQGIAGNWVWWNFLLGGMLTTFFFARLWRRAEVLTEVEFVELRYSGGAARFLRGFKALYLGLFMNVMIIGWVNFALISILQGFFDIPYTEALIYTGLAMLFVAIYSTFSGLLGVAITDVIQFIIAMTGCIILAVIVLHSPEVGGVEGLKAQLSGPKASALNFFPDISSSANAAGYTFTIGFAAFFARIGIQWWGSWYPGAEPGGGGYIVQRMMSAKNEKHSIYATLFFQVAHYCIRPWPWIIVGLCALVIYPDLPADQKQMGYIYAMRDFLPVGLKGLLLVAFFAAYMSTISTQLNWGASYLVNDFYKRFITSDDRYFNSERKDDAAIDASVAEQEQEYINKRSDSHYVMMSRVITVLLMFIAFGVTTQITSIADVWNFIFQAGAGLGLVLILRWYWWRINAWSEITASIAPFIGYGLSVFVFDFDFANTMFFTVAFTTICWLIATYATRPTAHHKLIYFYKKIHPDGAWAPIARETDIPINNTRLLNLGICWISAVVFTYSILFLTGKLILHEWGEAILYASTAVAGLIVLLIFIDKTRIFKD